MSNVNPNQARRLLRAAIPIAFGILVLTGCSQDPAPRSKPLNVSHKAASGSHIQFASVQETSNVEFVPRNGQDKSLYTILETLGSGVAIFDYDGDYRLDLFFPGGGDFDEGESPIGLPNALFRQLAPWRFERVRNAGLEEERLYSHGPAVGDFDADGFPDVLLTGYGGAILYHNRGDGSFAEVAHEESGLIAPDWSPSATWADFNNDGVLDCFLTGYLVWDPAHRPHCQRGKLPEICDPSHYKALDDRLFLGEGDGRFRDVSASCGLVDGGKGLAALAADWDLDGDTDLYVANDTTANWMYFNDGTGVFEERGLISGAALGLNSNEDGSMGVDLGDFNRDGLPDLWVTNYESQNFALYRNETHGLFRLVSRSTGIANLGELYVGFGTLFFDADLDGDEDLVAANGHVMRNARNAPIYQRPLMLENDGGRFENLSDVVGPYFQESHMGRGLAAGDLDRDGDLDLAITHTNDPAVLLENRTTSEGSSVQLKLIGTLSQRDAVGARITVISTETGIKIIRQVTGGRSYLSSSDPTVHLGLPQEMKTVELRIDWPSGLSVELTNVRVGQSYWLVEGSRTLTQCLE